MIRNKENILIIIIIVIVILGVLAYALDFGGIKTNSSDNWGKDSQDQLIQQCKKSLKDCTDIGKQKYDLSFSISEIREFNNSDETEDAKNFYNRWYDNSLVNIGLAVEFGSMFDQNIISENMPFVIIAVKIQSEERTFPTVVVCKNGELIGSSREKLFC